MANVVLDGESLTIEDVVAVAYAGPGEITLPLSGEALRKVARARAAVERFLSEERVVYGITTGFGAFKDRLIPPDQVAQLQRNIDESCNGRRATPSRRRWCGP
jgi:histidine ammonia-lyase